MGTNISEKEEEIVMQVEIIKNMAELFVTAFFMSGDTEAELALKAILQQVDNLERIVISNVNLTE